MKDSFNRVIQISVILPILFLFVFSSCIFPTEEPVPDNGGTINKKDTVEVVGQSIPSSGGTVIVNAPGNPIDGLKIEVPANSYPSDRDFQISTSEITTHNFGEYFNPISPLITIDNGGGYSDSIMEITIPVNVPEGHIPLGFYCDPITQKLEGIPVKNYTSGSITLMTRHFNSSPEFSTSSISTTSKSAKLLNTTCNLVISSIAESVVNEQAIISSGFKVGIDDWEFTNWGSYLSPKGHCAGQNFSAMWYYYEKKLKGEGPLFNKFSTNENMWEDNAVGYRFCSVIQEDLSWDSEVSNYFRKNIDKNQELDRLKYYTIAGAMLTTGEPQGISIYLETGKDSKGNSLYQGHALICYKISVSEGKLYISDPNYPNTERVINFVNERFEPYPASLKGGSKTDHYPYISWHAKTALIDWSLIGKRYGELLDGTIGNKAPNAFPSYTIVCSKGNLTHVSDNNYTTDSDKITFYVECPGAEVATTVDGIKRIGLDIVDENRWLVSSWPKDGAVVIEPKPGLNKLGFFIKGWKKSALNNEGGYEDLYIDYKQINITYSNITIRIEPNPITGIKDEAVIMTAETGGTVPDNPTFVWNFGDGTSPYTTSSNTISYTYANEGNYSVVVELLDETNKVIGSASALAIISGSTVTGILGKLQKCKSFGVTFNVSATLTSKLNGKDEKQSLFLGFVSSALEWEGTKFKASFDSTWTFTFPGGDEVGFIKYSYSGEMSEDGNTILSFTGENFDYKNNGHKGRDYSLSVSNIALTSAHEPTSSWDHNKYTFELKGSAVQSHVSNFDYTWKLLYGFEEYEVFSLKSTDYNDPDLAPWVHIVFEER